MLGKELEATLNEAFRSAREQRHEFMTVEHLLLALLSNRDALEVLRACGADIKQLEGDLRQHLAETVPALAPGDERETQPTLGFQRVLQRSLFHVQSSGKKQVTGANVLVALFGEREAHAAYLLNRQSVTRLDVVNFISHGISKVPDAGESGAQTSRGRGGEAKRSRAGSRPSSPSRSTSTGRPPRGAPTPSSGAATRSSARSRSSAAGARTIRCSWVTPASARPPSRRGWRR